MKKKTAINIKPEYRQRAQKLDLDLKTIMGSDIIEDEEAARRFLEMTKKKKRNLVWKIYRKNHPRATGFYTTSLGYVKSKNPDLYAATEDELIDKLYNYYFGDNSMEATFTRWMKKRVERGKVSNKTIREDYVIWNNVLKDDPLAQKPMDTIIPADIDDLYDRWTAYGELKKKEFGNRKSVLNGIWDQAVLDRIVPVNFIPNISTRDLIFKEQDPPNPYTVEDRKILLDYLKSLKEQDGYTLAIQFAFHTTMRIGEIKGLCFGKADENFVSIDQQLVEDNAIIVDEDGVHNGDPVNVLKKPKGNTHYSVRPIELTKEGAEILEKMAEISEDPSPGQLVFTFQGRPLTTDTFNRRLKKYCGEAGIEYRSSHKIRFCGASMLYQIGGMTLDQLRRVMGHSNSHMTEHYAQQNIQKPVNTGIMQSVLG